jgi:hypothetical protein
MDLLCHIDIRNYITLPNWGQYIHLFSILSLIGEEEHEKVFDKIDCNGSDYVGYACRIQQIQYNSNCEMFGGWYGRAN